jgi:tRNA uridine 5-carboxymethylaminomethyl modification enzyme
MRELLRDPALAPLGLSADEAAAIEADVKYAGYIARQHVEVERLERMEARRIPGGFDYARVQGLSNEARHALDRRRPLTIGEASRLSGVRPADVNLLLVTMAAG